jgi:DNA polymerase III epsilon subunit-like protein
MSVHGADDVITADRHEVELQPKSRENTLDVYFSADVETDGPIPGPFSMLSFALVYAGAYDGNKFVKPTRYEQHFYAELKPISAEFDIEALRVNGIDRDKLVREGQTPEAVMHAASEWVQNIAGDGKPVLVAYPLSFDWSWLYWYFIRFCSQSPFNYSRCFDIKTAFAVKAHLPIADAGRSRMEFKLRPHRSHTHHALDDAIEQAEIFANVFQWEGRSGRGT